MSFAIMIIFLTIGVPLLSAFAASGHFPPSIRTGSLKETATKPGPSLDKFTNPETLLTSEDDLVIYNAVPRRVLIEDNNHNNQGTTTYQPSWVADAMADPSSANSKIHITYRNPGEEDPWGASCLPFPEAASKAFNAGVAIWASIIRSNVPITISACWADLSASGYLGYSGGQLLRRDFSNAPIANTWYQGALANALAGKGLDPGHFDMHITYSSMVKWYYGIDGKPPESEFDFVSVAAQNIAHGLTSSGSACLDIDSECYAYGFRTADQTFSTIFDSFIESGTGDLLTSIDYSDSDKLGELFTSDDVWWNGPYANANNDGSRVKLYAPPEWVPGASMVHLDWDTFKPPNPNSLMVYALSAGAAQHEPGPATLGMLKDMGWSLDENLAPNDIILSSTSALEQQPINTLVGTFSTDDPNPADTFTYAFIPGEGSNDNDAFSLSGDQLRTAAVFDYHTQNIYNISVRSTDQGGLYVEKPFTISILEKIPNAEPPEFTSPESATFTIGASNSFTITSTGNPLPTISLTGALPDGITFSDNGNGTATLSGVPAVGNPIKNGDFEAGSDGSWQEYSTNGWPLIMAFNPGIAHSGTHSAWLGGDNLETSRLSQSVTIPESQHYLHFWYEIKSDDTCGNDFAFLKVNNTTVTAYDLCVDNDTTDWVPQVVDLSAFASSTVSIVFEVQTDSKNYSSFFLDTVSLSTSPQALEGTIDYQANAPFVGFENTYPLIFTASNGFEPEAEQQFTLTLISGPTPTVVQSTPTPTGTPTPSPTATITPTVEISDPIGENRMFLPLVMH